MTQAEMNLLENHSKAIFSLEKKFRMGAISQADLHTRVKDLLVVDYGVLLKLNTPTNSLPKDFVDNDHDGLS